ncbi:hypothetical protein NPIL_288361 [Nephila pilipes]|uniref:Uncharacterized protein n=1 Tax=Nephila pilipes TaxID=299642 RepID=A0A8X6UPC4_NEPPI|nr:hypothetical protein NPIL_288361 [Nephila pilipes]
MNVTTNTLRCAERPAKWIQPQPSDGALQLYPKRLCICPSTFYRNVFACLCAPLETSYGAPNLMDMDRIDSLVSSSICIGKTLACDNRRSAVNEIMYKSELENIILCYNSTGKLTFHQLYRSIYTFVNAHYGVYRS